LLRRTAERSVFVESLAKGPVRMAELICDSDPDSAEKLTTFAGDGRSLAYRMIAGPHRVMYGSPPSLKEVGDWEAAALRLRRELMRLDPEWCSEHPLVRNRVTGKGC
jgi:hypothetical protein